MIISKNKNKKNNNKKKITKLYNLKKILNKQFQISLLIKNLKLLHLMMKTNQKSKNNKINKNKKSKTKKVTNYNLKLKKNLQI